MDIKAMKEASANKCCSVVTSVIEDLGHFFADYILESRNGLVGTNDWGRMVDEIANIQAATEAAVKTIFNEDLVEMVTEKLKERSFEIYKSFEIEEEEE